MGVNVLGVVPATEEDVKLLARLIRAEAEGEGELGMLMVGNVGVNRVRSNCLDFQQLTSIRDMVYQSPGGFEATQKGYFYQKARPNEIRLARDIINGKRYDPATFSLWFFRPATDDCPAQWYNQANAGRYKSHCFYQPLETDCAGVYSTF